MEDYSVILNNNPLNPLEGYSVIPNNSPLPNQPKLEDYLGIPLPSLPNPLEGYSAIPRPPNNQPKRVDYSVIPLPSKAGVASSVIPMLIQPLLILPQMPLHPGDYLAILLPQQVVDCLAILPPLRGEVCSVIRLDKRLREEAYLAAIRLVGVYLVM